MKIIALILTAAVVASSVPAAAQKRNEVLPGVPRVLSDVELAAVERGVRQRLKDPESAQFQDVTAVVIERGSIVVCGLVNAKNSYGGYVGRKPFHGILVRTTDGTPIFAPLGVGGGEIDVKVTRKMCRERGIAI